MYFTVFGSDKNDPLDLARRQSAHGVPEKRLHDARHRVIILNRGNMSRKRTGRK